MDFNNQSEQNNTSEAAEDRISELPDPLIHHILSFIDDIKCVFCTSLLSKRWNRVWTSIPTLVFPSWDYDEPPSLSEISKFMDFVDRIFILHDGPRIQKFTLTLYSDMNASRVHSWIERLTRRCNIEELSLHMGFDQDIPLSIPLSLFTCESLVKLVLHIGTQSSYGLSPSWHFPKNFFYPKLKSLTLSQVQFGDGCWNEQPFSDCLVLEELILENCTWTGMSKFCILTPALKVLRIDNNLEEGEEGLEDCDLKIHAPSLVSLCYSGPVAKDYDMSSFLALDKADGVFCSFDVLSDHESRSQVQRVNHAVSRFLRGLSHVRCLSLYLLLEQVPSIPYDFVNNLPTFHNLDELDLLDGATTDEIIFALLREAPNLKCLVFGEFDHPSCDGEKEYDEPEDLFRHLQIVRFCQFKGEARELRWAKLILKYAKFLQTMTIKYSIYYPTANNKEVVMSEFSSFPRASESCAVEFI